MPQFRKMPAVGKILTLGWIVLVSATIPQHFLPLSSGFSYYDSGEDVALNGHHHGECLVQERHESRISNGICRKQQDCLEAFSNAAAGVEPLFCDTSDANRENWPVCCRTQERISEQQCTRFGSITSYGTMLAGGLKTKNSQLPYMVALEYNTTTRPMFLCGGTLISPNHVLTAAHCVIHEPNMKGPVSVLAGDVLLRPPGTPSRGGSRTQSPGRSQRRVRRIHTPPDYVSGSYYNDIAVLELEAPFKMSKYIAPACLPSPSRWLFAEKQLMIAGWGITKKDPKGKRPNVLRHGEVQKLSALECAAFGESVRHVIPDGIKVTQFCAGDAAMGPSGCSGDSGGPALVKKVDRSGREVHYVLGISSIGPSICSTHGVPNVYTNVQSYLGWIESVVWP